MKVIIQADPTKFVHNMTLIKEDAEPAKSVYALKFFHNPQDMLVAFEELSRMGRITEVYFTSENEYTKKYLDVLSKALKTESRFTEEKNVEIKEIKK